MKRSTQCRTCGVTIRPKAADMSLGAAVRTHYWQRHPDVMRPSAPTGRAFPRKRISARSGRR
ncbi:MAG: hypothetical protein ACRDJM_04360 [Actinomycetota bacterium]